MRPDSRLYGARRAHRPGGHRQPTATSRSTPPSEPGAGITTETMQFHGTANRYTLTGATAVADALHQRRPRRTGQPAVTLRSVGTQRRPGRDVRLRPRPVGHQPPDRATRPGPARTATAQTPDPVERPVLRRHRRPTGSTSTKVHIPQADEQQRLLANLITVMNRDRMPLPRFWYFPGTPQGGRRRHRRRPRHRRHRRAGSAPTPRPARRAARWRAWECPRFTSYVYPSTPLTNSAGGVVPRPGLRGRPAPAERLPQLHVASRACRDVYTTQLGAWRAKYPSVAVADHQPLPLHRLERLGLPAQGRAGQRASGSTPTTTTTRARGSQDRPGFMTGSGMPMRFTDTDGSMIDVYQANTR